MFDETRAVRELRQLADKPTLDGADYERLAMAVFGEMLAKGAAQRELWNKRAGGLISFHDYQDGRDAIRKSQALDPCWRRLERDLQLGRRQAFIGVQKAFAYAKRVGLMNNAMWGGERRRQTERIMFRAGVDPHAAPGTRTVSPPRDAPATTAPEEKAITPDVSSSAISGLPVDVQLGIADFWLGLGASERFLVNAMLHGEEQAKRAELLQSLAKDEVYERKGLRDVPPASDRWLRDFPGVFQEMVAALPKRSRARLAARYEQFAAHGMVGPIHEAVTEEMWATNGRPSAEFIMREVLHHLANTRDSIGVQVRYELDLDQGKKSFDAYIRLRERVPAKIAAAERRMAARHEEERHRELVAKLQATASDPGLRHISERYSRLWEISQRTTWQSLGATARGFGDAAVGTVEGLVTLITTDPRKTAAAMFHLAKNPQILVNALDDAMVDMDHFIGGVYFELFSSAIGAGPASKLTKAQKAAKLAQAAEKAAAAGKSRAAQRLFAKAESLAPGSTSTHVFSDLPEDLARLAALPKPEPYPALGKLKAYLGKRGVEVVDGAEGARMLDEMGSPTAEGAFVVAPPETPGGAASMRIVFRGEPSTAVVHHELWHRQDFLRRYGGDVEAWAKASEIDLDRAAYKNLTKGERKKRRWLSYSEHERVSQSSRMVEQERAASQAGATRYIGEHGTNNPRTFDKYVGPDGKPLPVLGLPQGYTLEQFRRFSKIAAEGTRHLGGEVLVQGSRVVGKAKPGGDIDIAVRVSPEQFAALIKQSFKDPKPGLSTERTMLSAIQRGRIHCGEAGLTAVKKQLEEIAKTGVDLSIIMIGGLFDQGPYMPLRLDGN